MKHKCPICKKIIKADSNEFKKSKFYPFCSERCKLIDLGAWLDVKYKIVSKNPKDQTDPDESSQQV